MRSAGLALVPLLAILAHGTGAWAEVPDLRQQLHREQVRGTLDLKVRQSMRRSRAVVAGSGSALGARERREATGQRFLHHRQQRRAGAIERQLGAGMTLNSRQTRHGALHRFQLERSSQIRSFGLGR